MGSDVTGVGAEQVLAMLRLTLSGSVNLCMFLLAGWNIYNQNVIFALVFFNSVQRILYILECGIF